jgi:signal transduction histidine kinase
MTEDRKTTSDRAFGEPVSPSKVAVSDELASLARELSHHVNNPLAVAISSLHTLERLTLEMASRCASDTERQELEEMLADTKASLDRLGMVARRLTSLSYQMSRNGHVLGDPFTRDF